MLDADLQDPPELLGRYMFHDGFGILKRWFMAGRASVKGETDVQKGHGQSVLST